MKVGDFIWNTWDNSILRYGTITSRKRAADKSAYAYYTVEWHDDSQYEASAMQDDDTTHREKKSYIIVKPIISNVAFISIKRAVCLNG